MSYIEAAFCTIEEYNAAEATRLMEQDLTADELYLVMFALRSQTKSREAAKLPAIVKDIKISNRSDLYVAQLSMLDEDLQPKYDVSATVRDGLWIDAATRLTVSGEPIKVACFKHYGTGLGGLEELLTSVPASNRELIAV